MFRLSPEWKHFFQSYGYWEEQHVVWAHWGRMLWGISEKEFHLGFEWTSRAQAHSWGCCQVRVLPPWLGFTSMKQSLIFHLPFILFFSMLMLCRKQRLSGAWFCLVRLVLLLLRVLLVTDSSVYICHFTKFCSAPGESIINTVSARKIVHF